MTFLTSHALRSRGVTTEPGNMEAKKEYQRFYIFARLQLGEGIQQIHSDLSELFGGGPWATQHALDGLESSLMEEKRLKMSTGRERQNQKGVKTQLNLYGSRLIRIHIILYERLVQTLVYLMALFKQYYWNI